MSKLVKVGDFWFRPEKIWAVSIVGDRQSTVVILHKGEDLKFELPDANQASLFARAIVTQINEHAPAVERASE